MLSHTLTNFEIQIYYQNEPKLHDDCFGNIIGVNSMMSEFLVLNFLILCLQANFRQILQNKQNKIVLLARSKLKSIENTISKAPTHVEIKNTISKALTHVEISHEQLVLVDNEAEKNNELKKRIEMMEEVI